MCKPFRIIALRLVCPEGLAKPRRKNSPLGCFCLSGTSFSSPHLYCAPLHFVWCAQRDSSSRVVKTAHWAVFAFQAPPFRVPIYIVHPCTSFGVPRGTRTPIGRLGGDCSILLSYGHIFSLVIIPNINKKIHNLLINCGL